MAGFERFFLAVRVLAGFWLLWQLRRVPGLVARPGNQAPDRPGVSVVIPARNEARLLSATLTALLPQLRPGDEVLVVDDHSVDDTSGVARTLGVPVLPAPPLPPGWTGKSWACWNGCQHTSQPIICFLDADTQLEPGGLERILAAQATRGGMVSVQPFHRVPTAVEHLSLFFNVVALMGIDAFTPLGERLAPRGAFGPVLVVGRDDYDQIGGHRQVAGDILDDCALASAWQRNGRRVTCFTGRGTASFRMYPDGLHHVLEGWTKNFASGAGRSRLPTLALIAAWISLVLQSGGWLFGLLTGRFATPGPAVVLGLYAVVALQVWWMARRVGTFRPLSAAVFPVGVVFFLFVFARSVVNTVGRRSVRWKGREIATGRLAHPAGPQKG